MIMISEELKVMIKLINRNKKELKGLHHFFDDKDLLITGIGYKSIQVIENGDSSNYKYYRYHQERGKRLCISLANIIQEKVLI